MLWSSAALISLLASLASTQDAPASLTERQGACTEGNGVDHYVMLHPGQYTTVMSMDKNKADEWAWPDLKDPSKQAVGPWFFTSKGPKPYTVEHFEVTTYLEVPGKTWAEVWGNPKSTVREGLFDVSVDVRVDAGS